MNDFELFLSERFGKQHARNATKVNAVTKVISDAGTNKYVTNEDMYLYYPEHFEHAGMVRVEATYQAIGYLAMVIDGYYAVLTLPAALSISPVGRQIVTIAEKEYVELYIPAGNILFNNMRVVKNSNVVYKIYNELVAKPNKPAFFNYDDALLCLSKCAMYAGLTLERTNVSTEIVVALTTRNADDLSEQYRHAIKTKNNVKPAFYGLRNIQYGVSNISTALMGSYGDEGLDTILATPPKKVEDYERILRL